MRPRRDTCRVCWRESATYQDGTIYKHRTEDRTALCMGSRRPPFRLPDTGEPLG